jgi:hypothetical protein
MNKIKYQCWNVFYVASFIFHIFNVVIVKKLENSLKLMEKVPS